MAVQSFTEEELQNLDKQTLIKLFLTTSLFSADNLATDKADRAAE